MNKFFVGGRVIGVDTLNTQKGGTYLRLKVEELRRDETYVPSTIYIEFFGNYKHEIEKYPYGLEGAYVEVEGELKGSVVNGRDGNPRCYLNASGRRIDVVGEAGNTMRVETTAATYSKASTPNIPADDLPF